jgi:hypothetical protein
LDPVLKNPSQKRAGGMAEGVGPEFKPQYHQKKKKKSLFKKYEAPWPVPPLSLFQ